MSDRAGFGVGTIRDAAKRRGEETSLRATADEIGMSYTAFRHFLKGGAPQPKTREKLAKWFVERQSANKTSRKEVALADVDAALRVLVHYATQDGRADVRAKRAREIVKRFEAATDAAD